MLNAKTKQDNLEILATKIDEVRAENAEMLKKLSATTIFCLVSATI